MYLCEFDAENPTDLEDRAQKRRNSQLFKDDDLEMRWPWKLSQGHLNNINSTFKRYHTKTYFGQFWHFKVLLWPWNLGQCHQNQINPSLFTTMYPCEFGQICMEPYFGHFKVPLWVWKQGQCHHNLINSFPLPNNVSMQVWSNIETRVCIFPGPD